MLTRRSFLRSRESSVLALSSAVPLFAHPVGAGAPRG